MVEPLAVHRGSDTVAGMARPPRADRSRVADINLTIRTSEHTRALLNALVAHAREQVASAGGTVSIGSYLTALIEREAKALGVQPKLEGETPSKPRGTTPKSKAPKR